MAADAVGAAPQLLLLRFGGKAERGFPVNTVALEHGGDNLLAEF